MRRGRVSRKRRKRKVRAEAHNFNSDGHLYYDLLEWMSKENFKHSKKMKPYTFEDTGRGLMSEETIYPGDVVISVPENLLIKPHRVLESLVGLYIKRCCPDATGQEILSVFVMCENAKGKASFWYPYIATLPRSYSIPAYCNRSALSAFPPSVRHAVVQQMDLVKRSFEKMNKLFVLLENSFPEFHGMFHYKIYLWAWSSVNTRCVYIECENYPCIGKSCSYHLALAPFLDLLNHHYDAQVKAGFNKEKRCYEIKSLKHFKKYSQVFINYGNHCNRQLFIEYGFVMKNNFNDIIPVSLDDILSAYKNLNMPSEIILKKDMLQNRSSRLSNVGFCKDGLTWGMDVLLKILCTEKVIGSSSMFSDIYLNESEKSVYWKLARETVLVKLKDFVWLCDKKFIKPDTSIDVETETVLNIARYLCSLEQDILMGILHCTEECNS